MRTITKQIKNFLDGMTPFPNEEGILRLENFDVTNNQLKPYRDLAMSGTDSTADAIYKFTKNYGSGAETLYALGNNFADTRFIIFEWNITNQQWEVFKSSATTAEYEKLIHYYKGNFYGLRLGQYLWRANASTVSLTLQALAYTNGNVDFITHSKDDLMYIATDYKIHSYDGTTLVTFTGLPTTYKITSIAEQGDFINIVGYDTVTGRSTSYLWDRDATLETLTAKYDMGEVQAYHNASLSGATFTISIGWESGNTSFTEEKRLIIGYIRDEYYVKNIYKFNSIDIYGKYTDGKSLYFNASVIFLGESTNHYVTFRLDDRGRLFIEQNIKANDSTDYQLYGLIKDGDGFWIGASAPSVDTTIGFNTGTTYANESIFETTYYKSDRLNESLDTKGVAVSFDPLPSGASVVVKTMADNETDWTTLGTEATDGKSKRGFAVNGLTTAERRKFRVESYGGAVVNGFQVDFETVNSEEYE